MDHPDIAPRSAIVGHNRVTDAGGDVAALLARDDVPKAIHCWPRTDAEAQP